MKGAMKAKDSLRLNTIRSVISSIKNQEINLKKELQDEEILALIYQEAKKEKKRLPCLNKENVRT